MDRNAGTMLLCLLLGAAVMYGSTNYRIQVAPVGTPEPKAPVFAPLPTPQPLPADVVRAARGTGEQMVRNEKVRPVAALLAAPPDFGIAVVEDGDVRWPVTPSKSEYRVFSKTIALVLDSSFSAQTLHFRTKRDGAFTEAKDKDTQITVAKRGALTVATVDLETLADKQSGVLYLELIGKNTDPAAGESGPAVITLRAASQPPGGQGLTLKATNSTYRAPEQVNAPVSLYARESVEPYLRLSGSKDESARLVFILQPTTGTATELTPELGAKLSSRDWEAGFKPTRQLDGSGAKVVVRTADATGRFYAEKSVSVMFRDLPVLAAPRLQFPLTLPPPANPDTSVPGRPAESPVSAPGLPAFYTNATSFKLQAEATEDVEAFVHYVDGELRPFGPSAIATGSFSTGQRVTFLIKDLTPGHHVIGVAAVRGLHIGPMAQVKVLVETQRPVVDDTRVAPGFGQTPGATDKIMMRFNHKMDPETIKGEAFRLTHNENTGATAAKIRSAQLDALGDTVTLNITDVVPGTYTVAVLKEKAPRDVFGNELVQAPVLDEKNLYETVVSTQLQGAPGAATPLASRTVGITHQTGPPVEFPEYVKFRISPDGFNPSDRVETRVVRLYYYRDAHRVAQLINRTVKSYNAAAVDVRRRMADAVRDNADKAEDDRKTLESRAVRAAQEARAAEAQLANLQNGIATARNQSATARIELLQRQQELEQAKRDLAREELLTPGRTNSDAVLEGQRQTIDMLDRDLVQLDLAIGNTTDPTAKAELDRRRRDVAIRRDAEKRKLDALLVQSQTRSDAAADAARARVRALETEIGKLQGVVTTGDLVERANADRIAAAQSALAAQRELEAKAVEAWQVKELQERRLRENQFRQETAAAREDPDTYAPGNPNSVDAVMQVSVSVIGEGLIQLRGPIKGLNVIRTMVNQIDAPVGQVRVAVHTLQVNGERADRMEKVVANIQRYLDHSRFLTTQSGQMLRNAVTSVASRKAAEVQATLAPGCTQWDRDQRYLYAFFGKDFIDELIQLDSEFLKTGNKLLSLHSMDSTSLSSALFLLALAKNDVRTEILNEFLAVVQRDLPEAEWKYYVAGISQPKHCDACKDKKMYLLAFNSQFQSLVGFFNAQVTGTDTLNPLQREFVKLAQIFKARMVTEMQLRQRVMERALLEERVGTKYLEELAKAKKFEDDAKEELQNLQKTLPQNLQGSLNAVDALTQRVSEVDAALIRTVKFIQSLNNDYEQTDDAIADDDERLRSKDGLRILRPVGGDKQQAWVLKFNPALSKVEPKKNRNTWYADFSGAPESRAQLTSALDFLEQFEYQGKAYLDAFKRCQAVILRLTTGEPEAQRLLWGTAANDEFMPIEGTTEYLQFLSDLELLVGAIRTETDAFRSALQGLSGALRKDSPDLSTALPAYQDIKTRAAERLKQNGKLAASIAPLLESAQNSFKSLQSYQAALKRARDARRPLDEKKLLDLLVDEMEDKFVEILEGTRAHTSNVDNYLKSISTALDDDFNTQYYLPSFRRAREASRYWDVTLSQIETTSVLTNNRSLGKVSPAATFEFDLPKRDILLTEGFRSAKALFDEYGALMNDPSFLALAKIYSGNPVSMMQQGGGGLSAVRNVLPGLPTSADEKILAQAGPGRQQFGAALDGLIPDPAIYKFETGTGYEIRPVLSPDGQAVVFGFDYMYTTDVREPVRADEKHLGRVKRHFVSTDVQLGNYELREVSKYMVSLKVARTGKGVQLLQDIPGVGVLFRPLPSAGSSLQQNLIYSQATIFPTMFDLMGLRYAPAVADLDPLADRMSEFAARYRRLDVEQRVYDIGSTRVDDALRTPYGERRYDLYRPQVSLPFVHPNGYTGLGLRLYDGTLREGYDVNSTFPDSRFAPGTSLEGRPKPYNFATPPGHGGVDVPPGFGPEYPLPPGSNLGDPHRLPGSPVVPQLTLPPGTTSGANPNIMKLPGMGAVGVGRPIPYNPALSTTPPPLRPSELPATNQRTVVTPGGPPVPRPSTPTALPPVRPQPVGLPPAPPVPTTTTGSR